MERCKQPQELAPLIPFPSHSRMRVETMTLYSYIHYCRPEVTSSLLPFPFDSYSDPLPHVPDSFYPYWNTYYIRRLSLAKILARTKGIQIFRKRASNVAHAIRFSSNQTWFLETPLCSVMSRKRRSSRKLAWTYGVL